MSELNNIIDPRERKFAEEIIKGKVPTVAAVLAGYTQTTANVRSGKILRKPHIQKAVQEFRENAEKRLERTFDKNFRKLDLLSETFVPDDPETLRALDPNQLQIGFKAIVEINKMMGNYAPTKNLNINANFNKDDRKKTIETMKSLLDEYKKEY